MNYPEISFKRVLTANDGGTWGDDPSGSGDTVVLRSTEQTSDGRWTIAEPELRYISPFEAQRFRLHEGDLLITKSSGSALHIGKTTVVDRSVASLKAVYSNFMQRVRLSSGEHPLYYWYVLRTPRIREQWVLNSTSTTGLANLNAASIGELLVPHPPLDEQRQIAEYLDRETGKIDELITKQEQLVKRLIERRSAQVYSAVTSGLDAGVGHRDSGYSEIGQTPLHWETRQLKHIIRSQKSGTSVLAADTPAGAGQVGVLKTSSVSTGMFKSGENKTVSDEELSRVTCPIRVGTILINRANSPAYVGAAAFVENSEPNLFLSDKLWQIDVHGCDAQFISWWMQTKRYRDQVGFHVVGASSSMQNLSYEAFRGIRLALPPLQEQIAIAAFLIIAISKIDDLVQKVAQTAGVLRERRAALISAAVTGKIDVRGLL